MIFNTSTTGNREIKGSIPIKINIQTKAIKAIKDRTAIKDNKDSRETRAIRAIKGTKDIKVIMEDITYITYFMETAVMDMVTTDMGMYTTTDMCMV